MPAKASTLSVGKWHEEAWTKVVDAQFDEIKKTFGEKAAKSANYGWGDASDGKKIDVATKVYAVGRNEKTQVLTTTAFYPSFEVEHDWNDY